MSDAGIGAKYAEPLVITDPEDANLEGAGDNVPVLLLTDGEDRLFFDGTGQEVAELGERIHLATVATLPEHTRRMRFSFPGSPEPVCLCGNGDEGNDHKGFYLGDDTGAYAGRFGAYSTIVCRECGRAGTFPLGSVPTRASLPEGPGPYVLPGYGFIVARANAEMVAAADELSFEPGDWRV